MNSQEIVQQLDYAVTIADIVFFLAGLSILTAWLLKTSMGTKALENSMPRRNNMHPFAPFILMLIWFVAGAAGISLLEYLPADVPEWKKVFLENLIMCGLTLAATVAALSLAKSHFVRQLKGFGLNIKTIGKDFLTAWLNMLAIWPMVVLALLLTIFIGQLIFGPEFQISQHQKLESISTHSQLSVRFLIFFTAAAVVPVFEEMLFRGLFQTVLRSYLGKPWTSIVITSIFFAIVHADPPHWPALFMLSAGMGYAYEKSGSLFRPIFIHAIFNAVSVIATLSM